MSRHIVIISIVIFQLLTALLLCARTIKESAALLLFLRSHAIVIVVHNNASGLLTGAFMPLDKKKEFIKNTSITNRIVILCGCVRLVPDRIVPSTNSSGTNM